MPANLEMSFSEKNGRCEQTRCSFAERRMGDNLVVCMMGGDK